MACSPTDALPGVGGANQRGPGLIWTAEQAAAAWGIPASGGPHRHEGQQTGQEEGWGQGDEGERSVQWTFQAVPGTRH